MMSTLTEVSPPQEDLSGDDGYSYSQGRQSDFLAYSSSDNRTDKSPTLSRKQSQSQTSGFGLGFDSGFEARTSYDATEHLLLNRSDNFYIKPQEPNDSIWNRKPPDFRPQIFGPHPPKRNARESMKPWKYGTYPGRKTMKSEKTKIELPPVLGIIQRPGRETTRIKTRFHIPDSNEARMISLREDLLSPGDYVSPRRHDFRQYPPLKKLGLPEFLTYSEPDPYNIKFNTARLDTIKGLHGKPPSERDVKGEQMAPVLKQPPHWERLSLQHPAGPWPSGEGSYTRHRRARNVASAFMQRVCGTLETQWAKEQLENELRKQKSQSATVILS